MRGGNFCLLLWGSGPHHNHGGSNLHFWGGEKGPNILGGAETPQWLFVSGRWSKGSQNLCTGGKKRSPASEPPTGFIRAVTLT